jgi:hypothetical protein
MPYPPAPWTLKGQSLQSLHLVDISKSRLFVPSELDIVSVLPGKTIAGVYLAIYGAGSALEYHELIVVPALVRYGKQFGAWVSHIYVDNPDSVAGGREIWGLPKELAEFTWTGDQIGQVTVQQGTRSLCTLRYNWQIPLWRQHLSVPSFSCLGDSFLLFKGDAESQLVVVGATIDVPVESPFAGLNLQQPWLTIKSEALKLVAGAPSLVGHSKTISRSMANS